MQRVIISAPFGNYLSFPGCTSTVGTFTPRYRGGAMYRLWRCLLTLRYNRRIGGWTNKLGLPNPGLESVKGQSLRGKIVSVHGFSESEWSTLLWWIRHVHSLDAGPPDAVELNLSCPNVRYRPRGEEVLQAVSDHLSSSTNIELIAKIPPVRWMEWVKTLYDFGVRTFHCCNTIPSPGGGISGKALKQYSLWAISDVKDKFPGAEVIGGGGITEEADVEDYLRAGADYIALGSMLFNPLNWKKVKRFVGMMERGYDGRGYNGLGERVGVKI